MASGSLIALERQTARPLKPPFPGPVRGFAAPALWRAASRAHPRDSPSSRGHDRRVGSIVFLWRQRRRGQAPVSAFRPVAPCNPAMSEGHNATLQRPRDIQLTIFLQY